MGWRTPHAAPTSAGWSGSTAAPTATPGSSPTTPRPAHDRLELARAVELLQLVDQDHRRVTVLRGVARRHHDLEPIVQPVTKLFHNPAGFGPVLRTSSLGLM